MLATEDWRKREGTTRVFGSAASGRTGGKDASEWTSRQEGKTAHLNLRW